MSERGTKQRSILRHQFSREAFFFSHALHCDAA